MIIPNKKNTLGVFTDLLLLCNMAKKHKTKPLASVGALSFLQCFDTVGWEAGRASGL